MFTNMYAKTLVYINCNGQFDTDARLPWY